MNVLYSQGGNPPSTAKGLLLGGDGEDGCLTSRESGMEACIQPSREIFLEGRLIHITLEVIMSICAIVATPFAIAAAIITIVGFVRSDKKKK